MLRASGTPLRADAQSPRIAGMCLVWHCARSLECGERPDAAEPTVAWCTNRPRPDAFCRQPWRSAVWSAPSPNRASFSLRAGKAWRPFSQCCGMAAGWAGIGLAPCRGARDLGYPLLAWGAATRLRGMAWGFAGLVQTSGWGIGFPSWAHGGRARSSLAFNSRSGVPQPASG